MEDYTMKYGVSFTDHGVKLQFGTKGKYGMNYGSRVYVMEGEKYKVFMLKNREFTFDVDLSETPCGLNAAVYFVGMNPEGDKGLGNNEAGAKYGLGYCDAQCPRHMKWLRGEANLDWDPATQQGHFGNCCPELDVFEANRNASAFTLHPCESAAPEQCEGGACGQTCDLAGCQFHSYPLGSQGFWGPGLEVDTTKPVTVVTQFLTFDGTDGGPLSEIRRFYRQNGKLINNSDASVGSYPDMKGRSITETFCNAQHAAQLSTGDALKDRSYTPEMGGYMKKMGEALDRGMVLILSLWDDPSTNMAWLDSPVGFGQTSERRLAYLNGPCFGRPQTARTEHAPSANVKYSSFKYGEIGSTCPDCPPPPAPPERTTSTKATTQPPTTTMVMTTTTSTKPLPRLPYFFRTPWFISLVAFSGVGLILYAIYLDLNSRGWEITMPGAREPIAYAPSG
jgi:cellulose 1,4-beta-cellobiosidase